MSESPQNPNPDYQDRDILIRPIMYFMGGLLVVTLIILGGLVLFFRVMDQQMDKAEADIPPAARERVLPPEPRLIVDEKMGLEEYLANARAILDHYQRLDDERVRIPIHVAIDQVVREGLPRWEPVSDPVVTPTDVE